MQMPEVFQQISSRGKWTGEIVVVNIEDTKVSQSIELCGECEVEDVVGEIQVLERDKVGHLWRDWTGKAEA